MQSSNFGKTLAGLLVLLAFVAVTGNAQAIRAPALYEQCAALAENTAQTEAIAKAGAQLKHNDPAKRSAAAASLAQTCDPRVTTLLLGLFNDEASAVRVAAAEALGKLGADEAIEPMIEALKDQDWRVRAALGLALGSFKQQAARNATLNVLVNTGNNPLTDEGDLRARCLGILVVNQMRDVRFSRKAISFLFDFLDHENPRLRQLAEETAAELKHTRNGVHELIAILKQSNFAEFRLKAAYWLGKWEAQEARAALAEASVGDRDAKVQKVAKEALANLKP
jgi:HEAT repeat protein